MRRWVSFGGLGLVATALLTRLRRARHRADARERELRAAVERLRLFVEHAPAAIALLDREMVYLAASRRYLTDFRVEGEVVGRSHYDVFPEIPARWREILRRCLAGAVERAEADVFPRADGTEDFLRWEVRPWRDDVGAVGGLILFSEVVTDRVRAERQVHEERERLAVTLRSIGDAVLATDAAGRVTLLNPVAEELTGWTADEARGRPVAEVFRVLNELTGEPIEDPTARALRDNAVVALANHASLVARDGAARPIADSGAPIRDDAGRVLGAVLVFRDQTLERLGARALQDSEARFRAIFEQASVGIAVAEAGTARFVDVNPGLCQMLGYSREELLARTWHEVTHPDDLARDREVVQATLSRGEVARMEKRYLRRDGATVWASITATPFIPEGEAVTRQLAVIVDLTARRRAEEVLRESEVRFRALIEKSSDMVLVTDAAMRITFWSPSAQEQLGWSAAEVMGVETPTFMHPDEQADARRNFGELITVPGGTGRSQRRVRHRDGTERTVEIVARNLLDEPAVRGVVLNLHDVTAQQRLSEQFQRAQRLESVGRLAGGIAHDFNNLLTVILSCAEVLEDDVGRGVGANPEDVREIRAAGERAQNLTRQLLAFARKQVIAPVALDLNDALRGNVRMLSRVLGEEIELVAELASELWAVFVDPGQVDQVILNLAVNARDAMPRGGRLTLATQNVSVDEPTALASPGLHAGQWVRLEVRDTGTGMDPEVLAHIFEPFFTTKEQGKGTGLGLASVYGIVEQAGGHVQVDSAPGRGTTFTVCLPRMRAPPSTPSQRPHAAVRGGTETILLAEDEPGVRAVVARALRSVGYTVLVASDGASALELAARTEGSIDLVVTDVVMPGIDGRAVVQALRRERPALRVLFISGYTDDILGERGVLEAGVALLSKPFTPTTLLERVRESLDGRPKGATTP